MASLKQLKAEVGGLHVLNVEQRGGAFCVVHAHAKKEGSSTDKVKGSVIKCFSIAEFGEAEARQKAWAMHSAIAHSQKENVQLFRNNIGTAEGAVKGWGTRKHGRAPKPEPEAPAPTPAQVKPTGYSLTAQFHDNDPKNLGGPGSGNHGHKGVHGQLGGSAPKDGGGLPDISKETTKSGRPVYKLITGGLEMGETPENILKYIKLHIPGSKITMGHIEKGKAFVKDAPKVPKTPSNPSPVSSPVPTAPKPVQKPTGPANTTPASLKGAYSGQADVNNPGAAAIRSKAMAETFLSGTQIKDAALQLTGPQDAQARTALIDEIGSGALKQKLHEQYVDTPLSDLQILKGMTWKDHPLAGQANCTWDRGVNMGSTSKIGDPRHELGHAVHMFLGAGMHSDGDHPLVKEMVSIHLESIGRYKAAMKAGGGDLSHEWFEKNTGLVGKRDLDSWHEHAAEQYRLYHRYIYQDAHEGGNGAKIAEYRERHPRWANVWDTWYTPAVKAKS